MLRRILNRNQDELLAENRRLLAELQQALARFDASADDQETLKRSALQLDELFLLVVAGEFNAGKSAFINALAGDRVLEEGVTPTTANLQLLTYGQTPSHTINPEGLHIITAPVELLRDIHIVDTPGTNAIHREHERLTTDFLPRADLVLFITSADRPFTESERQFLQTIRDWGKKIVIVVNKIDAREANPEAVLEEIREQFGGECLPLNLPAGGGSRVVDCFFHNTGEETDFSSVKEAHTRIIDQVVEVDDDMMALYLEQGEELEPEQLHDPFEKALRDGHLMPVCFVSAETGAGIPELLEIIARDGAGAGLRDRRLSRVFRRQSPAPGPGARRSRRPGAARDFEPGRNATPIRTCQAQALA